MAEQVLDWTFAEIPEEEDEPPAAPRLIRISATTPLARAWNWRWLRAPSQRAQRLLQVVVLLGLVLVMLILISIRVQQTGWQNIQAQITEAVQYEDVQARAGQVGAVLAMQVQTDQGWLAERTLEVSQNLPAPSPAPGLRLLPGTPTVSGLTASYVDQVQVTVTRAYADAAGQVYHFAWTQTYVSRQAGIWLRQPTESDAMRQTVTWSGARLTATFPLADQVWMSATLPLVEADLETACANGHCAPDQAAPLVFTNSLPLPPSAPGQVALLSPHLAGWPTDVTASQALRDSITTRALAYLAGRVTSNEAASRASQ